MSDVVDTIQSGPVEDSLFDPSDVIRKRISFGIISFPLCITGSFLLAFLLRDWMSEDSITWSNLRYVVPVYSGWVFISGSAVALFSLIVVETLPRRTIAGNLASTRPTEYVAKCVARFASLKHHFVANDDHKK